MKVENEKNVKKMVKVAQALKDVTEKHDLISVRYYGPSVSDEAPYVHMKTEQFLNCFDGWDEVDRNNSDYPFEYQAKVDGVVFFCLVTGWEHDLIKKGGKL